MVSETYWIAAVGIDGIVVVRSVIVAERTSDAGVDAAPRHRRRRRSQTGQKRRRRSDAVLT